MKKDILKSLLFAFLGLGITTLTFAGASTAITVPDKPGFPLAINIWETGCQIKYRAPKNDGGNPVANYYIEYRNQWNLSWKFRGISKTTEYQFKEMKENTNAQFRVSASNSAGISNPSGISDFITFRGRF
ncbi:fibronectin type III domain-containing protein [Butyricimonas hominis]|uniref:Fibronectin type III domain-containing protein n=1 Tax=Butyricimonas hominis TaxID=2763032 RepID=A0ABR7CZU9_9BACT|nr:fibronectin type III domain-containing protein [Butyricimonas hominis]MBC5621057.1 fibronectin type III domain-containing protein [Butyricimonas hominis]